MFGIQISQTISNDIKAVNSKMASEKSINNMYLIVRIRFWKLENSSIYVRMYLSFVETEAGESANFSNNFAKTWSKWYGTPLVSQIGSLAEYSLERNK